MNSHDSIYCRALMQISNCRPANFGKTTAGVFSIPSLIVVGAINAPFELTPYAGPTSGIPHVYAPGWLVQIANGRPGSDADQQYRHSKGTSDGASQGQTSVIFPIRSADLIAAAMTAGLAAYLIRLGQLGQLTDDQVNPRDRSPQGIKDFILEKAFSRYDTGRAGIYSNIDLGQPFCRWTDGDSFQQLLRRHDDDAKCEAPSTPTAGSSSTASSSSSQPTDTQTISFPPSLGQDLECHDEADFPGHADIKKSLVTYYAASASILWTGRPYGEWSAV